ncbi:hypothetical protein UCRNP2_3686 [Neofusicoccum parvum UCRNP2]|uniref:Uncharacterized protein n=1 Tax=Botryosphaeria parva (strain UCR-NP2) TaxID=1287680 RepID=R1GDB2_BOTPV|nr:hypothetical protein UCRNP2_3686 [Neofusicoccum parvum UCRNP2]
MFVRRPEVTKAMGDSRYSARLRKRPRVSYAQPDEEDLDIDDEGSTRVTATVGEADDDEDDEEFSLNGRKVSPQY